MWQILTQYHVLLFRGFFTTLELLFGVMLLGIPLGVLLGAIGGRLSSDVRKAIELAHFGVKVVPVLVFLFWLHYPLQALLGIVVDPFWTTIFALGIIDLIIVAFLVSTELTRLPKSYREAGVTLGLSRSQVMRHIELPILLRRILPQILLTQASMLEYTLFASLISVPELFRVAQTINAMIYQPVAIYSLLVIFFFVILAPMHLFIAWMQRTYVAVYA